jgi:hypothetical protein
MSIEASSIETAVAALSLATGVAAGIGGLRQLGFRRGEEKTADALKTQAAPEVSADTDPRRLNEYLFGRAGALSLREYVADAEVRAVVDRAIARVDELLEQPEWETEPAGNSPQLQAASNALQRGEVVAGLAHLRLAIEIALTDLAAGYEISPTRGAGPLLRRVTQAELLSAQQAQALSRAIRLANGALHGESVSIDEAIEAFTSARDGLKALAAGRSSDHG